MTYNLTTPPTSPYLGRHNIAQKPNDPMMFPHAGMHPLAGVGPQHENNHDNFNPHLNPNLNPEGPNPPHPGRVVVRGGRSYQVVGNDSNTRKCFAWAAFILLCICTLGLALISYQALTGWANGRCR